MKLTKLFTHTYDEGGYITENYNKLFSQITEDKLIGYINYLYDNRMFSELSNLDEALRMFSPKLGLSLLGGLGKSKNKNTRNVSILNPMGVYDYLKDRRQRRDAYNKIKEVRRQRDELNKERDKGITEVPSGRYVKDEDGNFREIIYEGLKDPFTGTERYRNMRYGNNPLQEAQYKLMKDFNDSRKGLLKGSDRWKSEGDKLLRKNGDYKKIRKDASANDQKVRDQIVNDIIARGDKAAEALNTKGDEAIESGLKNTVVPVYTDNSKPATPPPFNPQVATPPPFNPQVATPPPFVPKQASQPVTQTTPNYDYWWNSTSTIGPVNPNYDQVQQVTQVPRSAKKPQAPIGFKIPESGGKKVATPPPFNPQVATSQTSNSSGSKVDDYFLSGWFDEGGPKFTNKKPPTKVSTPFTKRLARGIKNLFIMSPEREREVQRENLQKQLIRNQKKGFGLPASVLKGKKLNYDPNSDMYYDILGNVYSKDPNGLDGSLAGMYTLKAHNAPAVERSPKSIIVNRSGVVTSAYSIKSNKNVHR